MAIYQDPAGMFALAGPDATDRCVELWTVERLRFETDQEDHERQMLTKHVAPAIASIRWRHGEVLRGTFISDERRKRQPDAENITFYNFGEKPFRLAPNWIRFERSYSPAPPCPAELCEPPPYYHRWEPVSPEAGFRYWKQRGGLVVAWIGVPCSGVMGDKGGQEAWLALRRADSVTVFETRDSSPDLGVKSILRVPSGGTARAVKAVKAVVDGSIASFQHFSKSDRSRAEEVAEQLAKNLRGGGKRPTAAELVDHLTNPHRTLFPRPPFNNRGRAQLNSYDEPCVVGEVQVIVDEKVSSPTLSGSIFLVEPRDLMEQAGMQARADLSE